MKLFKNSKIERVYDVINHVVRAMFERIGNVEKLLMQRIDMVYGEFLELRDELATNGVVRDLRKAEKKILALENAMEGVLGLVQDKFNELNNNGVATAINKLNAEVFKDRKEGDSDTFTRSLYAASGIELDQEPTLAGKVDAIIAHLGLDLKVEAEKKIPAKIVAKKVSTKKKGKR